MLWGNLVWLVFVVWFGWIRVWWSGCGSGVVWWLICGYCLVLGGCCFFWNFCGFVVFSVWLVFWGWRCWGCGSGSSFLVWVCVYRGSGGFGRCCCCRLVSCVWVFIVWGRLGFVFWFWLCLWYFFEFFGLGWIGCVGGYFICLCWWGFFLVGGWWLLVFWLGCWGYCWWWWWLFWWWCFGLDWGWLFLGWFR